LSLESAANLCRQMALEVQRQKITTSAAFITLIVEQVGDIAKAYWHEGREAADIPEEVTDMIIVGLCYLNWLGLSNEKIENCFQNSLAKLKGTWKSKPQRSLDPPTLRSIGKAD